MHTLFKRERESLRKSSAFRWQAVVPSEKKDYRRNHARETVSVVLDRPCGNAIIRASMHARTYNDRLYIQKEKGGHA